MNRADARALGEKYYQSDKPCRRGHTDKRLVSNGACTTCEVLREGSRTDKALRARVWRDENTERVVAYRKAYTRPHNPSTVQNKRVLNAARRARQLQAVPCWFGEWDSLVLSEASTLIDTRYAETGIRWHIDHMIPLCADTVSGLHCGDNIQVIPAVLNTMKCNRLMFTERYEWVGA